jgi:hypothetical protein
MACGSRILVFPVPSLCPCSYPNFGFYFPVIKLSKIKGLSVDHKKRRNFRFAFAIKKTRTVILLKNLYYKLSIY